MIKAEKPKIKQKKITYILEGNQGRKTQNKTKKNHLNSRGQSRVRFGGFQEFQRGFGGIFEAFAAVFSRHCGDISEGFQRRFQGLSEAF